MPECHILKIVQYGELTFDNFFIEKFNLDYILSSQNNEKAGDADINKLDQAKPHVLTQRDSDCFIENLVEIYKYCTGNLDLEHIIFGSLKISTGNELTCLMNSCAFVKKLTLDRCTISEKCKVKMNFKNEENCVLECIDFEYVMHSYKSSSDFENSIQLKSFPKSIRSIIVNGNGNVNGIKR